MTGEGVDTPARLVDSFSDYGTCSGDTLRALEYGGGALVLLIGDVTTYEFGVGTTVAQLREGVGEALQVTVGDDRVAPSFRLTDQSSSIFGQLTGTGPRDTALFVEAGESCGV